MIKDPAQAVSTEQQVAQQFSREAKLKSRLLKRRPSQRPSRLGLVAGESPVGSHAPGDESFDDLLWREIDKSKVESSLTTKLDVLSNVFKNATSSSAMMHLSRRSMASQNYLCNCTSALVRETATPGKHGTVCAIGFEESGRLFIGSPDMPLPKSTSGFKLAYYVEWDDDMLTDWWPIAERVIDEEAAEVQAARRFLVDNTRLPPIEILQLIVSAIDSIPPVLFFSSEYTFTNLRGQQNLVGKSISRGNPECRLSSMTSVPLEFWPDEICLLVAGLYVVLSSGGPNRIESLNGFCITYKAIRTNILRNFELYNPGLARSGQYDANSWWGLLVLAEKMSTLRTKLVDSTALHYKIDGIFRSKIECLFDKKKELSGLRELKRSLSQRLGLDIGDFWDAPEEAVSALEKAGSAESYAAFVESVVLSVHDVLDADFVMSRGPRQIGLIQQAFSSHDYSDLLNWDIEKFFCCVIPGAKSTNSLAGGVEAVADACWAFAARMEYNTWHVIPSNLPDQPTKHERDHLAAHMLPDLSVNLNFHHKGHTAFRIRTSARCPVPVQIGTYTVKSLIDIRALRCNGEPFDVSDLLVVTEAARFLGRILSHAASTPPHGHSWATVDRFGPEWHREYVYKMFST